jgi:hypothetical protein
LTLLRPIVAGVVGAVGVAIARHNLTQGPLFVAVAAALVVVCLVAHERGGALAALGIGAAGAFSAPAGLGPLLVAAGVVVACDVAGVDRGLGEWRDVIDATIALPALAGLAGTVAAQPSHRGVALGVVAAAALVVAALRPPTRQSRSSDVAVLSGIGLLGAFLILFAPDRVDAFGDLPTASVQGARSAATGFAVFALALVIGEVLARSSLLHGGRSTGTRGTNARSRPSPSPSALPRPTRRVRGTHAGRR